jgi:predicted Zn-dependent peptidase
MDDAQECSEIMAYMEMQFKSEKALVDHLGQIKAVSSEDIIDVANKYLQEDCLSTVILKPK